MAAGDSGDASDNVEDLNQQLKNTLRILDSLVRSAAKFSDEVSSAASSLSDAGSAVGSTSSGGGGSPPAATSQTTGVAKKQVPDTASGDTDDKEWKRRAQTSMRGAFQQEIDRVGGWGGVAAAGAMGTLKAGISFFNDTRPGLDAVMQYQLDRRAARTGGLDFSRFGSIVENSMNKYNVQDRAMFQSDVAYAMRTGWAQSFGNANFAGEQVGTAHTLAAMAGLAPETAMAAAEQMYSPNGYYTAMAMGVMTINPVTGDYYSQEHIINQIYNSPALNLKNASVDDIQRAMRPGGYLYATLSSVAGGDANTMEILKQGLIMRAESGKPLVEGGLDAVAEEIGIAGDKWTNALDSESNRQRSEQSVLVEYAEDAANGIATANELQTTANNWLADQTGLLRRILGAGATAGSFVDAMGAGMPNVTSWAMDTLSTGVSIGSGMMWARSAGSKAAASSLAVQAQGGGPGAQAMAFGRSVMSNRLVKGVTAVTGGVIAGSEMVEALNEGESGTDWGDYGKAAVGGAMTGASLFSFLGPLGMAGGALAGAGVGMIGTYLSSKFGGGNDENHSYAEGNYFVEKDMVANIHQGEMILPNRIAEGVRKELREGVSVSSQSEMRPVIINVNIQTASDAEALKFAQRVKRLMQYDDELLSAGSGAF